MPVTQTSSEPTLFFLLLELWGHLSRARRTQLAALVLLMLVSSLAEVLSLAAILPFMSVLTNPTSLWNQPLVQVWAPRFGFSRPEDLLLPFTFVFVVAALASGSIRLLTMLFNVRLSAGIGSDLSSEAYRRTLYQPYVVHLSHNSSKVIASINGDVGRVISKILNPLLLSLSSSLIVIALVATLLFIDWVLAIGAGSVIILVYAVVMAISKQPLQHLGKLQVAHNRESIQALQEGLGAIRDVLLDGSQQYYLAKYQLADKPLRLAQAHSSFLSSYPRYVIESAGMVLIAFIGYLIQLQGGVDKAIPLLGALALGVQKLLPMFQKVYEGWAQTRNAKHSLTNVLQLITQPLEKSVPQPDPQINKFKSIRLEEVDFRYRTDLPKVISHFCLQINRGERIGIIGSTGAGKSTLVDLLAGLLIPTAGRILVDELDLHDISCPERRVAWQSKIAYVSQTIYLSDSSIAQNIAFGRPHDQIDFKRVRYAAEQAQIAGFVESTANGYNTFVGERGMLLSGGQRQRIGIARALYQNAQVVIFDEATSALDNKTEQAVMKALDSLSRELTLVIIAHRLTTVSSCDRVIELGN